MDEYMGLDNEEIEDVSDEVISKEKEGWIDLLGNGQIMKKVVSEGDESLPKPRLRGEVTVRYDGHLEDVDGLIVDQSSNCTIVLGFSNLVSAVEMCIQSMHSGEIALVQTNARFAYGQLGSEPDIPPNSTLVYEVELLNVNEEYNMDEMTIDQWIQFAQQRKDRGNYFYGRDEFEKAVDVYNKMVTTVEPVVEDTKELGDIYKLNQALVQLYNNMAASQLKLDHMDACLRSCDKVLNLESNNHKALFRKGRVLMHNNDLKEAAVILQAAYEIQPYDIIRKELNNVKLQLKKQADREKLLYSKMLQVEPQSQRKRKTVVIGRRLLLGCLLAVILSVTVFHILSAFMS